MKTNLKNFTPFRNFNFQNPFSQLGFGKFLTGFILDLLFPRFCLRCRREGDYLCQDCQSTLEILNFHQKISSQNFNDLYFALPYQDSLIKNLIRKFKYQPFIKELSKPLASLMIEHFQLLDKGPNFSNFILIPVPLDKKRLKWRGFNQAEEISQELSKFLKLPILNRVLIKSKERPAQIELSEKERKENVRGVFSVKNSNLIKDKKILLIDDIYTTGSTLEECARVLKEARAKEIIGLVVARAKPKDDYFKNV